MAQYTIDFTKSTNLKAVYDAGLRPWTGRPGEEKSSLMVTDQRVKVIAPNGGTFMSDVEIGTFGLMAENQLSKADFISRPTAFAEALALTRDICRSLGIDVAAGAGMGGLEEKAAQLATLGDQTPVPQYWNGRVKTNGIRYSVTLIPLFGLKETRGKIFVGLRFAEPGKPMTSLTEPVKLPPGYEHMSMARPETHPDKPFPDPNYSRENFMKLFGERQANETDAITSASPVPMSRSTVVSDAPTPKANAVGESVSTNRKTPVWVWVTGLVAVALALVVVLKRRNDTQ